MKRASTVLAGALLLTAAPRIHVAHAQGPGPFPHARHAKLFPTCSGCHAGIANGDSARAFPSLALCGSCHDGAIQSRVAWQGHQSRGAGLLAFSHQRHSQRTPSARCESCHAVGGDTRWMNVSRATPASCVLCHAHGTVAHLDERNDCANCHRPLTSAVALSDARISAFPRPPSHDLPDFVSTHGAAARSATASCATCHARESCTRCHVNGAVQPQIRALGRDARVARLLAGRGASYPTPADHRESRFLQLHGAAARANAARCATCHTRTGCESCHAGGGAHDVLSSLPSQAEGSAPGAVLSVRVHPPGFARSHGVTASAGAQQCSTCHGERFCSSCHAGERLTRRYHPANFVSAHAPQAYSRETDCSSCHSTEVFCRDCHRQVGLAAKGTARSTVFHNAQPFWLLQHGRAARQDLKSCATCHQQSYCMQCHSELGARVNPHGRDFDGARMAARNPGICLYCHFTNPLPR